MYIFFTFYKLSRFTLNHNQTPAFVNYQRACNRSRASLRNRN